jgi:hypothetical protein
MRRALFWSITTRCGNFVDDRLPRNPNALLYVSKSVTSACPPHRLPQRGKSQPHLAPPPTRTPEPASGCRPMAARQWKRRNRCSAIPSFPPAHYTHLPNHSTLATGLHTSLSFRNTQQQVVKTLLSNAYNLSNIERADQGNGTEEERACRVDGVCCELTPIDANHS